MAPRFAEASTVGACGAPELLKDRPLELPWPSSVPGGTRRFCNKSGGGGSGWWTADFSGKEDAYQVLGVASNCSSTEIKASFRKLVKETHPDLQFRADSAATRRFLQIVAAYEILSDAERRAHYDIYLLSKKKPSLQRRSSRVSTVHVYDDHVTESGQIEVVEWLKRYRLAIHDILSEDIVVGSSYLEQLEGELYSAIRKAYFGPYIESLDLLPECFEAEERCGEETAEVLHLVSGRLLFGFVQIVNERSELSVERLSALPSVAAKVQKPCEDMSLSADYSAHRYFVEAEPSVHGNLAKQLMLNDEHEVDKPDAYKDVELHIAGNIIASATRIPPSQPHGDLPTEGSDDCINVFLYRHYHNLDDYSSASVSATPADSKILLGTITGLGTSPHEGLCSVYDCNGRKTHVIIKHRTMWVSVSSSETCRAPLAPISRGFLLANALVLWISERTCEVKHMHWYQVGDRVSSCECRCRRAQLPSSRFWLFEPRCGMHNIGGWYVETFGRDKKGRMVASKREWDDIQDPYMDNKTERLVPLGEYKRICCGTFISATS
ncbi:Chaperone protein [Nymphaea thermarum]|nr:Chaperone protein [Nymphaea thermarum]